MTKATKTPAIHAVWNKDLSITLFVRGSKLHKADGAFAMQHIECFLNGWFDTEDKKQHRVRWTYR